MAQDYRALKRKAQQKLLEKLAEQYAAALAQSANAIDAAAAVQARQQAEAIDERMQNTQRELDQMELSLPEPNRHDDPGRDPGRVHDLLRERLHRIDFRQVESAIRRVLDGDPAHGRAGLLLFQHCSRMNGRRCAERITSILKAEGGGLFQPYPIGLQPGDRNDTGAVLHRLARYFKLSIEGQSLPEQLAGVSETLCGSLQAGSIALIEISGCDWLTYDAPQALHWLVTDFWHRLLADLQATARQLPGSVTLIGLLIFDAELPAGAVAPAHCCDIDNLCRERVLEIELRRWTGVEVLEWLTRFGIPGHPLDEARHIADIIMRVSEGMPSLIENELLNRCAQLQPAR